MNIYLMRQKKNPLLCGGRWKLNVEFKQEKKNDRNKKQQIQKSYPYNNEQNGTEHSKTMQSEKL